MNGRAMPVENNLPERKQYFNLKRKELHYAKRNFGRIYRNGFVFRDTVYHGILRNFLLNKRATAMTFFKKILKELNNINHMTNNINRPTLERQFLNEVRHRKEVNSEHVWCCYYIPLAAQKIIRKNGTITKKDEFKLQCLANSLMFKDMAEGKLTDFYRFKEVENEA